MKSDVMLEALPPGKLPGWLLQKVLPVSPRDANVIVGPGLGMDAAAVIVGDRVIVAKNDPITFASDGSAEHLVEVNANDVACMGATPRWLLLTALLPHGVTPAAVLNQFGELREACSRRSVDLIGGHTEIVPGLVRPILVGMMLGETSRDELIEPGQAQPGDMLLLTKALAIEGSALLAKERRAELLERIGDHNLQLAEDLLRTPGISVVRDADAARRAGGVTALHDPTEGGFATAVREIATVSHAGADIDAHAIPILPETRAIADALGLDPLGMLASGALLIAARAEAVPAIKRSVEAEGIAINVVGRLTVDRGAFAMNTPSGQRELPEFAVDEVARELARPIKGQQSSATGR
ncbi:MAG: hydrogenase expression protein [Chloroflexia bacterium]|nr:hydrogenase expression protein [Chloroflexia bacterium]